MAVRERTNGASAEALCGRVLAQSDVRIGGPRPWDIEVKNPAVYRMALRQDMIGLGEAYVRGDWDCEEIDELVARMAHEPPISKFSPAEIWAYASASLADGGSRRAARTVGRRHYDLSPPVYRAMLDRRMTYSCGYWANATDLDSAQEAKLDLVCRKLGLQPGMRLLDIGGGWGSLVKFAAERYDVAATMVTISQEQFEFATASCAGLPVEVQLRDYRDLEGRYDRIASIGMFEHVGAKHYREYMKIARNHLTADGLFLLHCIGSNEPGTNNPWIERYIFPGGHIPAPSEVVAAIEGLFVMEDWHNFGADYDRTLCEWFRRFDAHWSEISDELGPEFYRRWKLYLLGCAGSFRARMLQLWQIVLSPSGVPGGYRRVS